MKLLETLRKRKLSVVGIFLVLLALDILISNQFISYSISPMLGEVFPFIKVDKPTKSLPDFVVRLYSWPFYIPLLIGGTLMIVDLGKVRKDREEAKVGAVEETVKW
jgi:hypothetical protein